MQTSIWIYMHNYSNYVITEHFFYVFPAKIKSLCCVYDKGKRKKNPCYDTLQPFNNADII